MKRVSVPMYVLFLSVQAKARIRPRPRSTHNLRLTDEIRSPGTHIWVLIVDIPTLSGFSAQA